MSFVYTNDVNFVQKLTSFSINQNRFRILKYYLISFSLFSHGAGKDASFLYTLSM